MYADKDSGSNSGAAQEVTQEMTRWQHWPRLRGNTGDGTGATPSTNNRKNHLF